MTDIDYAAEGYRITSRKYGTVSRIDRPDWKEFLLEEYPNWIGIMTDVQIADHYRRCYSKDKIDLGRKALTLKIPNSGDMV